jgi:hypothetical protein
MSLSNLSWYDVRRKSFLKSGNTAGFNITEVHPVEGITTEVNFTSDIMG